jgi:hypothetical protein
MEDRISSLSKRLYEFVKEYDIETRIYDNLGSDIKTEIDNIENEHYYEVKKHYTELAEGVDEQKSYNLLLQKQITTLKKEKMDLTMNINNLNNKLDNIEKDLGINIAMKRAKKKI